MGGFRREWPDVLIRNQINASRDIENSATGLCPAPASLRLCARGNSLFEIVRNKANSPRTGRDGAWGTWGLSLCPSPPPLPAFPGLSCETKPISLGAKLELSHLQEKSYVVPTCLIGPAKQSQFAPRCRSGDRRSRGGQCVKQSQFPGPGPGGRGAWGASLNPPPGCTNKANLPMRPEMGAGRRSCRLGTLRQTNPICYGRTGMTIGESFQVEQSLLSSFHKT